LSLSAILTLLLVPPLLRLTLSVPAMGSIRAPAGDPKAVG